MTDIAIRVENLGKCYHLYDTPRDRLNQFVIPRLQRMAGQTPKQYYREFWALKDISFEIKKGETVGIIGRNGSGKSTLLQLICGTLSPTSGSVKTVGRIAALLELGSGFNPDFTGRENVYINAAILGLSKEEVAERFADIAAFADIGEFIEQPVKTYSSGMFVRLAFAVNIMSRPEIMIVDEALSVGDMNFQAKCMTALNRMQERGTTVLFVSHDIGALKSLCSRGIYLEHGTVKAIGKAPDVAELYIRTMREEMNAETGRFLRTYTSFDKEINGQDEQIEYRGENEFITSEEFDKKVAPFRSGAGGARITFVEMLSEDGLPIQVVSFNQRVNVRVCVLSNTEQNISINLILQDQNKLNLAEANFRTTDTPLVKSKRGARYIVTYSFNLPLGEGYYSFRAHISSPLLTDQKAYFLDVVENAVVFHMMRWDKARIWSSVYLFPEAQLVEI